MNDDPIGTTMPKYDDRIGMAAEDSFGSSAAFEYSSRLGRRLDTWGSIALLAGLLGIVVDLQHDSIWLKVLKTVTASALVGVGVWALVRSRRHLTRVLPGARFVPAGERVVLYLRSFSDDPGFGRMDGLSLRDLWQCPSTPADLRTEDQQVARGMATFGRVVALGKSSDRLPHPGAERSYVPDGRWQDEVLAALDRAGLVLLAARPGQGLEEEVAQTVRHDPARLVILVSRDRSQYAQFRESVHELFPKGLPDYPKPRARRRSFQGYVRAVIWFDPDWTPHWKTLDGRYPFSGAAIWTRYALPRAVQPLYTRPLAGLKQSRRLGKLLEKWGTFALLIGALFLLSITQYDTVWWDPLMPVIGVALAGFGTWARVRGRRHLTRVLPGLRFLPADERVVLYLRSFSDDAGFARMGGLRIRSVVKNVLKGGPTLADLRTEEQQVAHGVAAFGRMVALGKPSDRLPQPGAERSYVADEQWQNEVLAGLDRAALVLLAAGPGEGLEWEVDQVMRRDPARLVIVVSRDREQYARFKDTVQDRFPGGLPDYPESPVRQRLFRGRYVRAVIWFDADWTPHLEMLDGEYPLSGAATRTQRALLDVLRPVYERADVPVPREGETTKPRPKEVLLGVVLSSLGFVAAFALVIVMSVITLPAALAIALPVVAILSVPLVLWMQQVLRGGPLAIFLLQVAGVFQGIGMLVVFVIMEVLLQAEEAGAAQNFASFLGGACLIAMLAPPAATFVLLRREVREWIESRT